MIARNHWHVVVFAIAAFLASWTGVWSDAKYDHVNVRFTDPGINQPWRPDGVVADFGNPRKDNIGQIYVYIPTDEQLAGKSALFKVPHHRHKKCLYCWANSSKSNRRLPTYSLLKKSREGDNGYYYQLRWRPDCEDTPCARSTAKN